MPCKHICICDDGHIRTHLIRIRLKNHSWMVVIRLETMTAGQLQDGGLVYSLLQHLPGQMVPTLASIKGYSLPLQWNSYSIG